MARRWWADSGVTAAGGLGRYSLTILPHSHGMHAEAALAGDPPELDEGRMRTAALVLGLRGRGISDLKVLKAIETVPRAPFVPEAWRHHAYSDHPLPIACGQTISAPSTVAMMTSSLEVSDRHSVLEIGTGSGYQTAILARLARRVTSIERFRTLARAAEKRLLALGFHNVSVVVGDGMLGWSRQAPFDRMLITAACTRPPGGLINQLSDHGILIAPIGPVEGPQRLTLFQRIGPAVDTCDLGAVRFLPAVSGMAAVL